MNNDPKIKTQIPGIVVRPTGTMNQDIDKRYLNKGDFYDSLNTRAVTNTGGTTLDREAILGNTEAIVIDPLVLQNKVIRILVRGGCEAGTFSIEYDFFDANGKYLTTSVAPAVGGASSTQVADAVKLSIEQAFTALGSPYSVAVTQGVHDAVYNAVRVEFTGIPYYDYSIAVAASNTWSCATFIYTIQEPIDASLLGGWFQIGKYDLEGQLITWWTTQRHLPTEINTVLAPFIPYTNNLGEIQVTTAIPHNIPVGTMNFLIQIKGSAYTAANGFWIANAIDATNLVLRGSVFTPPPLFPGPPVLPRGIIVKWVKGIGEIDHSVKNWEIGGWATTRLLRSTEFNFVTQKGIKAYCEKSAFRQAYYWTDDYNVPRVLYSYNISGQLDSLLQWVDPLNTYAFDTVGVESVLMVGADIDARFAFAGQISSGGAVRAGNWRYAVRFLTETVSATAWIPLGTDNPISVFKASISGSPHNIIGDDAGDPTGKINTFTLTGSVLGVFRYVELAGINYQGSSITGEIIRRALITSDSMTLQHTGNELEVQDLDPGTIGAISATYLAALSIDGGDGRLALSNLRSPAVLDFAPWVDTWTHSLDMKTLTGVGDSEAGYRYGEFMDPNNVYNYAGYMINETYRFGAVFRLKNGGGYTPAYHIQDITFNTDALFPRRTSALPTQDLGSAIFDETYVPYIKFQIPISNSVKIGDVSIRDLVDEIHIVRVECVKEVLSTGIGVMGVAGYWTYSGPGGVSDEYHYYANAGGGATEAGEFPFVSGSNLNTGLQNLIGGAPFFLQTYSNWGTGPTASLEPRRISYYSADIMFGNTAFDFFSGDQLLNYGTPSNGTSYSPVADTCDVEVCAGYVGAQDGWFNHFYRQFSGDFGSVFFPLPETLTVDDAMMVSDGQSETFPIVGGVYSKNMFLDRATPASEGSCYRKYINHHCERSPVFHVTTDPDDNTFNTGFGERGVLYLQHFRPLVDKYGDARDSDYIPTGSIVYLEDSPIGAFFVFTATFGGDVFTQKNYLKNRVMITAPKCGGTKNIGMSQEISWYSQNRVNAQMWRPPTGSLTLYPYGNTLSTWLNSYADTAMLYNSGYDIRNGLVSISAYDSTAKYNTEYPTRFIWSQRDDPESATDNKRIFLPLDFKDADYGDGEIVHHKFMNGELMSWQPDRFSRWYFDSNALINTTGGAEIILGSGDVMARPPLRLSQYGCSDPYGIVIGVADQGGDTAYWICKRKFAFLRFGYDGTSDKGAITGLDSWFRNNLNLVYAKVTPYDDEGIHGVWNHAFKEVIITCRSWKGDYSPWGVADAYNEGDIVYYGTLTGATGTPAFWIALGDMPPPASDYVPGISELWAPFTPSADYFSIWSIVYSEIKNGFDGFVTFAPRIYSEYANTFLSAKPGPDQSRLFEHNQGTWMTWYGSAYNGYWHGVLNYDPEETKSYYGIRIKSEIVPFRVEFYNKLYQTYADAADFELLENHYDASIKNDSTVTVVGVNGAVANPTGLNSLDTTSFMPGDHLEIKMIFQSGFYQNLFSATVRTQLKPRNKST